MTEPSGAIGIASLLTGAAGITDTAQHDDDDECGDVVVVISGRNVDERSFATWISDVGHTCPVSGATK